MRLTFNNNSYIDITNSPTDKALYNLEIVDKYGNLLYAGTNMAGAEVETIQQQYRDRIENE
jgi:acyl CoA:acetate/3-ketoacid CoA transferase alpha subunit